MTSPAATAARLLEQVPSAAGVELAWLRELVRAHRAEGGIACAVRHDTGDEVLRLVGVQSTGWPGGEGLEGTELARVVRPEDLPDVDGCTCLDGAELEPVLGRVLPDPPAVGSVLAWCVTSRGRFLGAMLLVRSARRAPWTDDDAVGPATTWARATEELLKATDARWRRRAPLRRSVLLVHPDGTPWMTDGRSGVLAAPIQEALQAFCEGGARRGETIDRHAHVRFTHLEGASEAGVVVEVDPMVTAGVSPYSRLTRLQRQVGAFLASGATLPETAAALERGRETVKEHLASIYRALGISSRVELTAAYRAALDWVPQEPPAPSAE